MKLIAMMMAVLLSMTLMAEEKSKASVKIPSSMTGYVVGPVKKGQTIVIKYSSGKWSPRKGGVAACNPDKDGVGNEYRLAIFSQVGDKQTRLKSVPPNTDKTPFEYTFDDDYEKILLHMDNGTTGGYDDNSGYVRYYVEVR